MNRVVTYIIVSLLCSITTVWAESYDRVERRNIWNEGRNVTGIVRDSLSISNAELYYSSEQGDLHNFSDASELWSAGGEAHTITHFNKVSMIGSFSYSQSQGEEMSGSMFISPNSYPFDLLEFTPGRKSLQSYYLMGGIASEINSRLNIGVKGEYGAQTYVKYKDLRHYNYRMELKLMPSISYSFGDITVGMSYIYERNSETIRAQEVGSTAAAYYAFLDKGLMMGAYETWGGSGIHLDVSGVDGFPVRENFNGLAVQIEWRGIYGDFEYLRGSGEVGEKETYWFDFPSQQYTARLGYTKNMGNRINLFSLELQHYTIHNYENVLGTVTENGVSNTKIYGSTKIFSSEQLSITPRYELMWLTHRIKGSLDPEWRETRPLMASVAVGANYFRDYSRATQMYPYVDELTSRYYQLYIEGSAPVGRFELGARLLFSTGGIDDNSYSVSANIEAEDSPTQLTEYYNIENEYLTATKLCSQLSLRYNITRSLYTEAAAEYTNAFNLDYIAGDYRWGYTFKLGYKF